MSESYIKLGHDSYSSQRSEFITKEKKRKEKKKGEGSCDSLAPQICNEDIIV
jgi:hypothetical protein